MDLTILHILEAFREGAGAFLNTFFSQITLLGDKDIAPIIMALIYWCISREFGTYILLGYQWNRLFNGFAKVTACAYRPWIRDPSLVPDEASLPGATGYSFPSGHSMNASTIYGGIGVDKKLDKRLRACGWILVLLIAFARIYMCVHTPQDVLVGIIAGCLVMYIVYRLLPVINKHKNGDFITAGITVVLAIIIAVYAATKSYPVDYDENGKILVEGAKMAVDTYKAVGWNCGFFIGWIIERRFVKFSDADSMQERGLRLISGLVLYYFVNSAILPLIKTAIGGNVGTIVSCALQMLFIVLGYPALIKLFQKKNNQ